MLNLRHIHGNILENGCYTAVKKLKEEGYTQVTAFIAEETDVKPETYTWKYIRKHKCIVK